MLDNDLVGEAFAATLPASGAECVLVLGIGNVLMGDEGVGVHALRALETRTPLRGVRLLDGGTGGVNLLQEILGADDIILVDATRDGRPAGTITFLQLDSVGALPRGLGAHDFGLKDLFAAAALLGRLPRLHLFTISVETVQPMSMSLSPAVAAALPELVHAVRAHAARQAAESLVGHES
ncbi:MAG TPA: hydrogenase maturation protease [Candidatus Didemnitutus sp.]|nr:hydrogenase maturation protease [Candidatus Didemnitutus sp.]